MLFSDVRDRIRLHREHERRGPADSSRDYLADLELGISCDKRPLSARNAYARLREGTTASGANRTLRRNCG